MSIKQKIKIKTFTGSGSFDVREEMLKDSTDLLDNVEVTNGQFNILKWDKREFRYYPLEVDMYQKG